MSDKPKKIKLLEHVHRAHPELDEKTARSLILAGKVMANDQVVTSAAQKFPTDTVIRIDLPSKYVSRGGLKLEAALKHFKVSIQDLTCADLGSSTGGFTDCLLQHGAQKVYAVDTAYNELDWKLRSDDRVFVLEKNNAQKVELPEKVDFISIDISLVPLQEILPAARKLLKPEGKIIALIKPQYQASQEDVPEGGVLKDETLIESLLSDVEKWCTKNQFKVHGIIPSPIKGGGGNKEYLIHLS